jgi:hypothetical protein
MVVYGNRQHTLRRILTDDVLIQECLDLLRCRQGVQGQSFFALALNGIVRIEKLLAGVDTVVADVNAGVGRGDQAEHLVLCPSAKGTTTDVAVLSEIGHIGFSFLKQNGLLKSMQQKHTGVIFAFDSTVLRTIKRGVR